MTTNYPGGIDAFNNPDSAGGDDLDTPGVLHDEQHSDANDAIEAIETELGTTPSGAFTTVKARIENAETDVATAQATADAALPVAGGTMTGDLILDHDPVMNLEAATKRYADQTSATAAASVLVNSYPLLSQAMIWYDARAGDLSDLKARLPAGDTIPDGANVVEPDFLPYTGPPYLFLPGWDDMWVDTPFTMPSDGFILRIDHTDSWPGASTSIPYAVAHQGDETDFTFALFRDATTGDLTFLYSYDGTTIESVDCPVTPSAGTGRAGLAVKMDATAGTVTFYEVGPPAVDLFMGPLSGWAEIGEVSITPGSLHQSSLNLSLSGFDQYNGAPMTAKGAYARFVVSDVDDTPMADLDPAIVPLPMTDWFVQGGYPPVGPVTTAKDTDFLGGEGETWTLHVFETHSRPPLFVNRAAVLVGNDGNITLPDTNSYNLADSDYDLSADITIVHAVLAYHVETGFAIGSHADAIPPAGGVGWAFYNFPPTTSFTIGDGSNWGGCTAPSLEIGRPTILVAQVDRTTDEATLWVNGETTSGPADISAVGDAGNDLDILMSGFDPDASVFNDKQSFAWYATIIFNRLLTEEERTVFLPYELGFPYLADAEIPPGGTAGQALVKASDEDFDTEWATVGGGGGNGELSGPVFASGKYAAWSGSIDTRTLNEDRGFYVPIVPDRDITIDRIGLEITSTATGSPLVRLGIYEDADGVPGALLLDAGTINGASATYQEITVSQALEAGVRYWLCCVQQGGSSNGACRATRYATHVSIPSSGYSPYEAGSWMDADAQPGALSDPAPAMNDVASAAPRIMVRVV